MMRIGRVLADDQLMQDKVGRDEAMERGRNRQNKPKDKQNKKMMLRSALRATIRRCVETRAEFRYITERRTI